MGTIIDSVHFRHQGDTKEFLSGLYQVYGLNYPKFFKMDLLSKAGLLAAETLFRVHPADEQTALVFANAASSLETDRLFRQTIQEEEFFPSPSVFVYTLPNIVLGEVCIRHHLYGEQIFFISPKLNAERLAHHSHILLAQGSNQVIGAWLACERDTCDVFAFLARPDATGIPLNKTTINHLYKK